MNKGTMHTSRRVLRSVVGRRGATMVEYALLLFAVLIIAAQAFKQLGPKIRDGAKTAGKNL